MKRVALFNRADTRELNIIGQDITGYGMDLYGKRALPEMLQKICRKAKNIGWIRLLYLYPGQILDELLRVIAAEPKICKYIDLPVQHINERILKLMHRNTTKKQILSLIEKIRKQFPFVAIRTSLITGFPSETDKEFEELLKFIEEVKFERLGAFIYSREEGTAAYNYPGQVTDSIKRSRFNQIMSIQQRISEENNKKLFGQTIKVLIEEKTKDGYLGRTEFDAPEVDGLVFVKSAKGKAVGEFAQVKITGTLEYDLLGELDDEHC